MKEDMFKLEVEKLGINCTDEMLDKLKLYCTFLLEYNKHTNLTAIRNEEDVYLKHFYDSLTLVKAVNLNQISTFLDIGSGAGFPGIVLKIFYPHLSGTLIDSNNKKTTFLKALVEKLELINIEIVNDRIENYSKNHLNCFDLVTARAVTNMRVLAELSLPLVRPNGFLVAMKGKVEDEFKEAQDTISIMGGELVETISFTLIQENSDRSLVKLKKLRETLLSEVRTYDKIVKKPLQKNDK